MSYCVECKAEHAPGSEGDGYHHGEWDELGMAQGESEEAVVRGDLKVTFENIGEGWSGDYDPEDPEDDNLLRIYTFLRSGKGKKREWLEVEDGSICTSLPAKTPPQRRRAILEMVFADIEAGIDRNEGRVPRRLMDGMSYVNPEWPKHGGPSHAIFGPELMPS